MNRVLLGFGVALAAVAPAALVFDDAEPRRVVVNLPDGARYVGEIDGGAFHGTGRCLNRVLGYPCPDSPRMRRGGRAGVSA